MNKNKNVLHKQTISFATSKQYIQTCNEIHRTTRNDHGTFCSKYQINVYK